MVAINATEAKKTGQAGGVGGRNHYGPQGGGAPQIYPNYGRHQFVPQLVTETMIRENESNRELKGVKRLLPIKKIDYGENILKIQRALNNAVWSKVKRRLLDGVKGEHSVNIRFQWKSRRNPKTHFSKVECVGMTRVQV